MLKYKIKLLGNSITIPINLEMGNVDYVDYKEDHENDFKEEKEKSINPILNSDVVRYKPTGTIISSFEFYFGTSGTLSFTNAGFTQEEIDSKADVFINSHFIIQAYDSADSIKQVLLHTNYLNSNDTFSPGSATLSVTTAMESMMTYLPKTFLDSASENFTLYFKYLFYNAKTGKLSTFTQQLPQLTIESQMYFPMSFTKSSRSYVLASNYKMKELPSSQYTDIVDNSVESIRLEKPTYPTGNNFTVEGTYNQID